jgi:hypothetical protein
MEYADSGTLRDYLKEHFTKFLGMINSTSLQLADSVTCLHHEGIVQLLYIMI